MGSLDYMKGIKEIRPEYLIKPKVGRRITTSFTIKRDLLEEFREYCNKKGLFMSRVVEKSIEKFLENKRI